MVDQKLKISKKFKITICLLIALIIAFIIWLCLWSGFNYSKVVELVTNLINAIVGGFVTIIGVFITLEHNNEQLANTIQENRDNYKKDIALKLMPHLKIVLCDGSTLTLESVYFKATKEKIDKGAYSSNSIECKVNITNVGLGTAINTNIEIESSKGKFYNNIEIDYLFDLSVDKDIVLHLRLFEQNDGIYDFALTYTDIIYNNKYKQKGKMYIEGKRINSIILDENKIIVER